MISHHKIYAIFMIFGLFSGCANAKEVGVESTLFDGRVSFCYSKPMETIITQGRTGLLELDEVDSPSLVAMNEKLHGFKRILTPAIKPKWSDFITGANVRWTRLCAVKLPTKAKPYYRAGRWMVDPDYDDTNAVDYPSVHRDPSLKGYSVDNRFWFVGDKLVHVEIKATK